MKLFRYVLPLHHGIREGILIQTQQGWGEVAPLPGWSKETFNEALSELRSGKYTSPSVLFGMDSASVTQKIFPATLPLAALLLGTPEDILEKAHASFKDGYTHAKLKVAHLSFQDALDLTKELKNLFRLRIDVNRAWNLEQTLHFFSHFSYDDFDYIEEPVSDPSDLVHFTHPFALDETLRDHFAEKFSSYPHLKAFIFKPSLQGGYSSLKHLMTLNKPIILSSAFESGVGIFQIASFIQRLSLPLYPLGLDTYRFLQQDLLETPLSFTGGYMQLPSSIQPKMHFLHEL